VIGNSLLFVVISAKIGRFLPSPFSVYLSFHGSVFAFGSIVALSVPYTSNIEDRRYFPNIDIRFCR
jgi:hypothetical protein